MPSLELQLFVVSFFVEGPPRTKGSMRAFVHPKAPTKAVLRPQSSEAQDTWLFKVKSTALLAMRETYDPRPEGAVELSLEFRFERPKSHYRTGRNERVMKPDAPLYPKAGDLDKLQRAVFDALEGVCYENDSQVVAVSARKAYADRFEGFAGVSVTVFAAPAAVLKHSSVASG